jgi:hypothetical protein
MPLRKPAILQSLQSLQNTLTLCIYLTKAVLAIYVYIRVPCTISVLLALLQALLLLYFTGTTFLLLTCKGMNSRVPANTHTHTHTHTFIVAGFHTHTHIHTHTPANESCGLSHPYIHTHIHTYIHTHMHTHIHTHIHLQTRVAGFHTHTYIHTYIHTHTHAHTHTHTHTYTCKRESRAFEACDQNWLAGWHFALAIDARI